MIRISHRLALLMLLFAACSPDFEPASKVEKLRLLALRAEPPEIAPDYALGNPPGGAQLGALVAHPSFAVDPTRRATVVHIACTPSSDNMITSPCTTLALLSDPTYYVTQADFTASCVDPGVGQTGGISFSGVESCGADGCEPALVLRDPANSSTSATLPSPKYILPGSLGLDGLAQGVPERILGVDVVDLVLVLDASPTELAPASAVADDCTALGAFMQNFTDQWLGREHVAGVKRLHVRGPDATDEPNRNPAVAGILLADQPLPSTDPIASQTEAILRPELSDSAGDLHQSYARHDATGAVISNEVEEWTFAWFATAGSLDDLHTLEAEAETWTVELPSPEGGKVLLYAVVYDSRGGTDWVIRDVDVVP